MLKPIDDRLKKTTNNKNNSNRVYCKHHLNLAVYLRGALKQEDIFMDHIVSTRFDFMRPSQVHKMFCNEFYEVK